MDRRARRIGILLIIGCLWLAAFDVGAAQPVRIELTGEVTYSDFFTLPPGTPIALSLLLDAQTADENPAVGEYAATGPGTFESEFFSAFPVGVWTGDVAAVSADSSTGTWNAELLDTLLGNTAISVSLLGTGLGPDQILPNHLSFTSATAEYEEIGGAYFGARTEVTFDTVAIIPIEIPVPALGPWAVVGLVTLLGALGSALSGRAARRC